MISVAIDGPSGSGKSTVSKQVARVHGFGYLDTGAMYRVAAWWAQHTGIDLHDSDAVIQATRTMPVHFNLDPDDQFITCDGHDITTAIRTPELSAVVSIVAVNLGVRAVLKEKQREIIESQARPDSYSQGRGIVAEGRDITTVVYPEADVRVLLTASEDARLARRAKEITGKDDAETKESIRDIVVRRDRDDSTVSRFMEAADGVTHIDSSDLTIDEVTELISTLIKDKS